MNRIDSLFPGAGGDSPDLFRGGAGGDDPGEFTRAVNKWRFASPRDPEPEATVKYLSGLEMNDGGRLGAARLQAAIHFVAMLGSGSPLYLEDVVRHWINTDRFG